MEKMRQICSIYLERLEKRDRLGNVGKDESIILKYITINLTKIECENGLVLTDSGYVPMAVFFEYGNEITASIRDR
jgi:predicted AlkP superfamily phosphohydrolase/phosphomutase